MKDIVHKQNLIITSFNHIKELKSQKVLKFVFLTMYGQNVGVEL